MITATPAEPVLPYNGTGENGAGCFLSCSPFSAGPQDGNNPAGQGFKVWRFFLCRACGRKNTTHPLTGWIGGAGGQLNNGYLRYFHSATKNNVFGQNAVSKRCVFRGKHHLCAVQMGAVMSLYYQS